ncbi:MAG: efflux RND transporter permease subunit [Verrucomicrobiota bacterium]
MNLAELSIKHRTISWVMTVMLLVGGYFSYTGLGRLEDPEFTIKDAIIYTPYPGATAEEVEQEVTDEIEKACQELGQLKRVKSQSKRGLSVVTATIKDKYDKNQLPQVWDELRRKINDAQGDLPPGAGPSLINDDYGDVFGIFFAVTGEGYSYAEIRDYADLLKRELLLVPDVKKVDLYGVQDEVIYVEMSRAKMAALGISQEVIYDSLEKKNLVADSGHVQVGPDFIPINPTGDFTSVDQFKDLLISNTGGRLIYLGDVAEIRRGYVDPPSTMLKFDGAPALGIGISTVSGGNVVTMGEAVQKRIKELEGQAPVGMEINVVSFQSEAVTAAIDNFVNSLLQAIGIVIVVLFVFMGLRCALLIGAVLLITIMGTFIFMDMMELQLQRISLGALVIALGMLVDNAIVITEGMLIKIEAGEDRLEAAKEVVAKNIWPLLGATFIAVLAFGPIGLSDDSTGEYCGSLFWVLFISLLLSWLTGVTITPLFCYLFLKGSATAEGEEKKDPYSGRFFMMYRRLLEYCIRFRAMTIGVVVGLFAFSIYLFTLLDQSFFPPSTRPQFMVDLWMPEGSHIRSTEKAVAEVEEHILQLPNVTGSTTFIGQGGMRFLLTYTGEQPNDAYAQLLVSVDDYRKIDTLQPQLQSWLDENYPDSSPLVKKFVLGPGDGGKIQIRFSGPDYDELRAMSEQCMAIMAANGGVGIRSDWRQKIKVLQPELSEAQARRAGIDRTELALALMAGFEGYKTGVYREGDKLLDIIARSPENERNDVTNINNLLVWSQTAQAMIPLRQIVADFRTVFVDSQIWRRNRIPTVTVHCDPSEGVASALLEKIMPELEQIPLPSNEYFLELGGEAENSSDAQAGLAAKLPMFVLFMVLIVIFLFDSLRQPLIIWLTVPLALIGVAVGLLVCLQPFGFMALLGTLSLSGMLIKNSIVLIDAIDTNIREGMEYYEGIIAAGLSRFRPVLMAAVTTVLGMVPLLADAFYIAMAVTIMFGLAFATALTLIIIPVLYAVFFRVKSPQPHETEVTV